MFRHPSALAWLLPALALAGGSLFWASQRRKRLSTLLGDAATLSQLLPPETASRRKLKAVLRLSALVLLFLALAGPQWGVELAPTQAAVNQALVAVDVSTSMMTEDAKPSRLERAKGELSLMLDGLKGNRVGVIAFAGEAAVLCPVTIDIDAAKQILGALEPGIIPVAGTGIGKAIRLATQALQRYTGGKALILISDGEDHKTDPLGAAAEAAKDGVKIFSIGIGSPEGEPIPVKDPATGAVTGYKKDKQGRTVISRLGEETLRQVAAATGGAYYRATPGENEAQEIVRQVLNLEKSQGMTGSASRYKNRFMFPLAAALLLLLSELLVAERRPASSVMERDAPPDDRGGGRPAAKAALLILLFAAVPSRAATAEGALRDGNRLYQKEEYVPALEKYAQAGRKSPQDHRPVFNAGDALYRLEEYDQAEQAFGSLTQAGLPAEVRANAFYNLGAIHVQKGDIKAAVSDYRDAVMLAPQDEDSRHNLAVALRMLKNPPPKKNKKDEQEKKDKKQDKKEEQPKPEEQKRDNKENKPPETKTRPQDQLSREDAQRILRGVSEKEKAAQQQLQKRQVQKKQPDVEEDW